MASSVNSEYNNDINSWPEAIRQLENIAKAGFTHIQWIHDWQAEYMYSKSEMYYARDLLRDLGLKCHTVHSTEGGVRLLKKPDGTAEFRNRYRLLTDIRKDYTSTVEFIRLAGVDLIRNRIDFASLVGAYAIVQHMQLPWKMFEESGDDKKEYYKQAFKSIDELEAYARNAGVKIAFENLIVTPERHMEECFDRLFDRYDSGYIGYCYDSGHAVLQCRGNFYHFAEKYNSRLIVCHLQDVDPITEEMAADDYQIYKHDYHRVPFSGTAVNWEKVADLVATSPTELPADFEVGIYGNRDEEWSQLVECRTRAEKFFDMVAARRKTA
ncbi:MAG: sugar phosphate isomerase/epimerase [Treponema sp.]|jgi:sugar phosphate isomerase/epimerase|nr:sugar phosphate isomerase/epimerase [Treponema sp.]